MSRRELSKAEREALEVAAQAKREAREREVMADTMENIGRRRAGLKAEAKAVELATKDAAIAAHARGFTYDQIAERLDISRQRVAQLLARRPTSKAKRQAQADAALERAKKAAASAPAGDGLVPAVSEL